MSRKALTQFPQIPVIRTADQQQSKFNAAVREALAMMTGTKQDRVLTVRDVTGGALSGLTLTGALVDQGAQPPAGSTGPVQRPTQPTGVKANAGMQSVFMQWDLPTYSGHAYTEVYRFDADSLALAQPVAKVVYVLFSEFVGSNKTYFYWLRHVNVNGVAGPWNASEGLKLQTAIDVDEVLRSLSQQITESQFAQSLVGRINLIDRSNDGGLVAAQARLSEQLTEANERLTNSDVLLDQSLQEAKDLLQGQITSQGGQIVSLQIADSQQAQNLIALLFRTADVENTVLYLDSVTQDHASRLASIETVNGTQGSSISSLQTTTASHATSISRLGVYDTAAGKYAFIKTLEQADATQAGRISTLEADNASSKSRITSAETVNATQATKLTALETDNTSNKNKISTLETTDASHASRLTSIESVSSTQSSKITTLETADANKASRLSVLETDNGTNKSRLVSLETTDATQASRIEQLSFSQGDGVTAKTLTALSASIVGKTVASVASSATVYLNARGYVEIVGDQRLYTVQPFAIDSGRKYSVRLVVKQLVDSSVGNTMNVYGGVHCLDKSFNSLGNNRYCAASSVNISVASGRVVFDGVITGEGSAQSSFIAGTRYVRPMFIVNYSGGNGTVEVESIEIRDITASAAVEDAARAYTDTKTGEIRAERTIKVEADGRVAGIGLIAGGATGSAIYFSADKLAILPPGATSVTAPRLPFIYDAVSGGIYMDTTFIRELTANKISGGILNLEQGNILDLTVFQSFLPPPQFLQATHLSPDLAARLAWVDPNAVLTGGTITKVVSGAIATTPIGTILSGGQTVSVKISGTGTGYTLSTPLSGYIDVQLLRNGVAVSVNGVATHRLTVFSTLATDEYPVELRRYKPGISGGFDGAVSASAANISADWSIKVVGHSGITAYAVDFRISASVFEAFGSSGGIIANTSWDKIANKPTVAAGWLTDVSLIGHTHSAADITSGTLAAARGGTGRTDGKVTALATARTLTIGSAGKTFDGSANVSWTLAEIGAAGVTGAGASGTWGINISGNASSVTNGVYTTGGSLTGPLVSSSEVSAKYLGIESTSLLGEGLSLYGGAPASGIPLYGMALALTSMFGTHGAVTGDVATYFTEGGATNRGWIFRLGATNVASISGTGVFSGNGSGLTALNASNLTAGVVDNARLVGTYSGITLKLDGSNTLFTTPNSGSPSTVARSVYNLVEFKSSSATTTGAIVFIAPTTSTAIMMKLTIEGMYYASGLGFSVTIQGYRSSSTSSWSNLSMVSHGPRDIDIRLGVDPSGRACVIIGNTDTVTSYPHVAITHAMFSHSSATDAYCSGWTTGQVVDLTGYTYVSANIPQSSSGVSKQADDALLLGGLPLNTSGVNNLPNQVVRTLGDGYLYTGWINTVSGDRGTTAPTRIYASTDGFIRYYTPANFALVMQPYQVSWGQVSSVGGASKVAQFASNGYLYVDSWIRAGDASGLFWSSGMHLFNSGNTLVCRSAYPDTAIRVEGSGGVAGYVYGEVPTGTIGFLTKSANWGFQMNSSGDCKATGTLSGTDVIYTSDSSVKTRLKPIKNAVRKVAALTGYTYHRTDMKKQSAGLIAQHVQKVLPEAVVKNDSGLLGVSPSGIIALLVQAVTELSHEISLLKGAK